MAASTKRVKNIKFISNCIAYQSIAYFNTPIHVITCYLSPVAEDAAAVRICIQHLKAMVANILSIFKRSKLVVMGDFNSRWMPEVRQYLAKQGLNPALDLETATHTAGGQLDQIFTNMPVVQATGITVQYSDHLAVVVDLTFTKNASDLDLRSIPLQLSQKQIRQVATADVVKQHIISQPSSLDTPLRDILAAHYPKKGRISHWYKQPPRWYLCQERDGGKDLKQERDQEWQRLLSSIERAHGEGRAKDFHSLVK